MLYRALRMAFWAINDHLGKLVLLNLFCAVPVVLLAFLVLVLPLAPALITLVIVLAVILPALLAAFGHVARLIVEKRDVDVLDFLHGLRAFAMQGIAVGVVFGAALVLSLGGAFYYLTQLAQPTPLYAYLLAAVCLWFGVFFAAAYTFALPAIAQKRAGVVAAIKTGVFLVADNPLFCGLTLLHLFAIATCSIFLPLFLTLSLALTAVLQATAYEMLARKYAAPLVDGKRTLTYNDADDDYLNRGLRDFFFPWKM